MNEQTQKLLIHCNYGCTMAIDSMKQILGYVEDDTLEKVIKKSVQEHERLEKSSSDLLAAEGISEKEPGFMENAFIWFNTDMKLMIQDGNHQIVKILMNGCNMGIQSISEKLNEYCKADKTARNLAEKLISEEENFMKELKQYI